jgi:hypothetical protein
LNPETTDQQISEAGDAYRYQRFTTRLLMRDLRFDANAAGPDNCSPACDQAPPNAGRTADLDDLVAFLQSLTFEALIFKSGFE